jgi:hypothetical protein
VARWEIVEKIKTLTMGCYNKCKIRKRNKQEHRMQKEVDKVIHCYLFKILHLKQGECYERVTGILASRDQKL